MEQASATFPNSNSAAKSGNWVFFESKEGVATEAPLLRIGNGTVAFELMSPTATLEVSEVVPRMQVVANGHTIYNDEVVVRNAIFTGSSYIWEVSLRKELSNEIPAGTGGFEGFQHKWQQFCKVHPDYKLAVVDLQDFLANLRIWLEEAELASAKKGEACVSEEELIAHASRALPTMTALFQRFEAAAGQVQADVLSIHERFCRRLLHPLLLCSPFMHRIYAKPLGYAGDYEMIDMIVRNRAEGPSLLGKILHSFILDQEPARSVRNRVDFFTRQITQETARAASKGRVARILTVGCGPACEIQRFLEESALADRAHFSLLDFNAETLERTIKKLSQLKKVHRRETQFETVRRSVHQLLKSGVRSSSIAQFDFIYCSGLYDYLTDSVCRVLNDYLFEQLLPGGALIVTNFDPSNPIRRIQEHIFDWYLIYRSGREFEALAPRSGDTSACRVHAETTGCNIFLEARKPNTNR